jgi:hypothetical protein
MNELHYKILKILNLKNISFYFEMHFVFFPKRFFYNVRAGRMRPTMFFRMFYLRNG